MGEKKQTLSKEKNVLFRNGCLMKYFFLNNTKTLFFWKLSTRRIFCSHYLTFFFNKQPVNKQLGLNNQTVKQLSVLGCADLSNHKKLK